MGDFIRNRNWLAATVVVALSLAVGLIGKAHSATINEDAIAVIIGNKTYNGNIPEVSFAHNDAAAMRKFVVEALGFREGNIIDLRDATRNQLEIVFGNKETHKGKLFDWIRSGESDVVVYYSGHGVPGLRDRRAYLLPVDGDANRAEISGYPLDTLYKNLSKLPAKSVRVFIDACFSGESPKGMLVKAASGISVDPKVPNSGSGLTIITAAQGDQLASWDQDSKMGLFTKHLLEAMYGAADGEKYGNQDGRVTLAEVGKYLDQEMSYQARRKFGRVQEASVTGDRSVVLMTDFDGEKVASYLPVPKPSTSAKPAKGVYPGNYKPGDAFKDCEKCPEMVIVPAGSFRMRRVVSEGQVEDEPTDVITIAKPFAVGKYEVTFEEWDSCVADGGCDGYRPNDENWGRGKRPVINISWYDTQSYLKWISFKTLQNYKLLSRAEWLYVAKAGTNSKYHFGDVISGKDANFQNRQTTLVGGYAANDFGLYDTHGNVWEWVEDCWNGGSSNPSSSPAAFIIGQCNQHALQGGSWTDYSWSLRFNYRNKSYAIQRYPTNGFRIARKVR